MIDVIFTLDYEIYGNGRGSLDELVSGPAECLRTVFEKYKVPMVVFVEAAELEMIERRGTDPAIAAVKDQVRELAGLGHEIGLHLHPQWYKGTYSSGAWALDYSEYDLCSLPKARIDELVGRAVGWLGGALGHPGFTLFSFRAGNWLFQPSRDLADVLIGHGLGLDSSVYKGGRQHLHGLDYRPSLKNGYYWSFSNDVNKPDPYGRLLEVPIYTRQVPVWRMFTSKRIGLQKKILSGPAASGGRIARAKDLLRPLFPLKLDFCRMGPKEFKALIDIEIKRDRLDPGKQRPIVAIGHTKDLVDLETIDFALHYLMSHGATITTFKGLAEGLAVKAAAGADR